MTSRSSNTPATPVSNPASAQGVGPKQTWMFAYTSPAYEWAQCEGAGISLRIGNRAWTFGRFDYREKNCPWPRWARFRLVLGHKPYPGMKREWSIRFFNRQFKIGGKD